MTEFTTIEQQVLIAAPVALVWQVLTTLERYGDWNQYAHFAQGQLSVGATVEIIAQVGTSQQRVNNRVLTVIPEQQLCWVSLNWYQALVRGTRCRFLYPQPDGQTLFLEREVLVGPLAPLVVHFLRAQLTAGLRLECDSLKAEAERLLRQTN